MELLTKELLDAFKKQGNCSEKKPEDVKIIIKMFNPCGKGTWYCTEYNPKDKIFFGFVSIFNDHCDELGYFSLDELKSVKGPLGLGIERDLHFGEHTLKEVLDGDRP